MRKPASYNISDMVTNKWSVDGSMLIITHIYWTLGEWWYVLYNPQFPHRDIIRPETTLNNDYMVIA